MPTGKEGHRLTGVWGGEKRDDDEEKADVSVGDREERIIRRKSMGGMVCVVGKEVVGRI